MRRMGGITVSGDELRMGLDVFGHGMIGFCGYSTGCIKKKWMS